MNNTQQYYAIKKYSIHEIIIYNYVYSKHNVAKVWKYVDYLFVVIASKYFYQDMLI